MSGNWNADRNTIFYRTAAIIGLIAVLVGFWLTYTRPVLEGTYTEPWWGHIHGALALAWTILVIIQTQLASRHIGVHRKLGFSAIAIIPLWFASTVTLTREFALMNVESVGRDIAQGNVLGSLLSPLIVMVLVAIALYFRKQPQAHKRLMFIATVLMLWPAWSRWRHYFGDTEANQFLFGFVIALAPILLAMLRDKIKFGAVHPALLWGGLFVLMEQSLEIALYGTPAWNAASTVLFNLIV